MFSFVNKNLLSIRRFSRAILPLVANLTNFNVSFLQIISVYINPLNTKPRLLYLKTQFVPRIKHFPSRLQKPTSL